MRYANRIVALVSGIMLSVVCMYVSSSLLVTSRPDSDYRFLGDGFFAHVVIEGLMPALPLLVLSLVLSWITLRWLARPPRVAVWWCLGGLIAGFICWELGLAVRDHYSCVYWISDYARRYYSSHPGVYMSPPPESAPQCSVLNTIYWRFHDLIWSNLEFLAVPSGLAAAAAIVLKSERITARAVPA
jgi:hypothetical protein